MWRYFKLSLISESNEEKSNKQDACNVQDTGEKEESVCLLRESPLRILRVAESGNVKEFKRIVSGDPSRLVVHDSRGRRPVHQAAAKNRKEILQIIVEYGGDLNIRDEEGNTPLHLAADKEAVDAIELLLMNNSNSRIQNNKNRSPLHLAAELNRVASLKAFSKQSALIYTNQGGPLGRTALHLACINDHHECVAILVEALNASPKRTCSHGSLPIHEAAKRGSWRALKALLDAAVDRGYSTEEMMTLSDAEGNLAIHAAIQGSDWNTVRVCLEAGAKISAPQREKSTAVHLACAQGALNIVKLMFELQPEEMESSMNSCDVERLTPLHYAAMFDHTDLVEYLVSQGACLDLLDKKRRTPLHLAAARNSCSTVRTLIHLRADTKLQDSDGRTVLHTIVMYNSDLCNILEDETAMCLIPILEVTDKRGNTALHIATKQGQITSISKLLTLGASVTTRNCDGDNMFHVACRYGHTKVIQQILQLQSFSFVINESNGTGATPLHIAAKEGYHRIVHTLMQKGAMLHRDHDGRTPVHLASQNGHTEAMKTLLSIHGHLINMEDKNGDTALHNAALNDQAKAVDLLLKLECNLTYNKDGQSAIDYAIMNKFTEVAYVMATHKHRADEVLGMTEGKYPCIMEALVAKMPGVARAVLDNSIKKSANEKLDSPSFHVEYDFKWLTKPEASNDTEKGERLPPEQRFLPILNAMVAHGRVTLLSHELSMKYLQMKWDAYGKYFQWTSTLFYLAYLTLLTVIFTNGMNTGEEFWVRYYEFNKEIPMNNTIYCRPTSQSYAIQRWKALVAEGKILYHGGAEGLRNDSTMNYPCIALQVISAFNIVVEILNVCRHGIKYCKNVDTWIWVAMNLACFGTITVVQEQTVDESSYMRRSTEYVSSGMAVAAFLGWFYLLLLIRRSETVGLYVSMFLEILKTLLRVLVIFSILIMAFALAFYILLSNGNHIVFSTFPMSVMRTFSMMLGDLDFMNTFAYPHHCGEMERQEKMRTKSYACVNECQYSRRIPDPFTTFPAVGIYMIFMPIVMINFLIGLAVGDIDSVRKNAQLQRLSMQVQSHTNLEKMLPKCFIRRVDKKTVIEYPNVQKRFTRIRAAIVAFFHYSAPNKDEGDEVRVESNDLMEAILDMNSTLTNLASDVENMRYLLISHKGGGDLMQRMQNIPATESLRVLDNTRGPFQRSRNSRFSRRGPPPFNRSESSDSTNLN